jgi:uncharacterized protein (DUF1697 family)
MARYVAFLRAVNVGRRTVVMARARQVLEELSLEQVSSFVNSGNLLFTASGSSTAHESSIRAALEDAFGFEITTFVRTATQVRSLVSAKPFGAIAAGHTHFALLPLNPLSAAEKKAAQAMSNDHDEVVALGRDLHCLIRSKSTETTLGPKAWKAALPENPTTARNVTMLTRLVEKL